MSLRLNVIPCTTNESGRELAGREVWDGENHSLNDLLVGGRAEGAAVEGGGEMAREEVIRLSGSV